MSNIVVFDLDGTLALTEHRQHFIEKPTNWDAYYDACDMDEPNFPIISLANSLRSYAYEIFILTGRSDQVKDKTIKWLDTYDVTWHEMFMRPNGNFNSDYILKEAWVREIGIDNIAMAFDDRNQSVAMFRSLGITCLQVAPGDF
jgi:hypothetical protein